MAEFYVNVDDEDVDIKFEVMGEEIIFTDSVGSKALAWVLRDRIEDEMQKRLRAVRIAAYKAGARATRGRGAKVVEFQDCINSNIVGWDEEGEAVK